MSQVPPELIEQLQRSNVVLFTGAGLSVSAGLPSGQQLVQELAQRQPEVAGRPFPEAMQAYQLLRSRQSLLDYLMHRIDDPAIPPGRAHHLIAALPLTRVFTTNWDTLQETAWRQARKRVTLVVRDNELAYTDAQTIQLVKMHGTITQPDSIVVTEDDYLDFFDRRPQIAQALGHYAATQTLLFLGYSLSDPDFKRIMAEVGRRVGREMRRSYAVQLHPNPLDVRNWEGKNVQVIDAELTAFLDELATALGTTTTPPAVAPTTPPGVPPALPAIEPRAEERASLERQLAQHRKNLTRLEEQAALFGMRIPLDLLNEIDFTKEEIRKLEERLSRL